jgi:hypothetical protein
MIAVYGEAAALLVGKEGFDLAALPIPLNCRFGLPQITDQIQRCLVGSLPDGQRLDWTMARLRIDPQARN